MLARYQPSAASRAARRDGVSTAQAAAEMAEARLRSLRRVGPTFLP